MYAKVIALGLAAAAFAVEGSRDWLPRGGSADTTPRFSLVPQAVGEWRLTSQWLYPNGGRQFQEYGSYARGKLQATLSFDHYPLRRHSVVDCFVGRGEALESSTVRSLHTLNGSARFNVARFASAGSLSLVAASQCLAQGCIENPPTATWADLLHLPYWKQTMLAPRYSAVPVSISIAGDAAAPLAQMEFEQALEDFTAHLDLGAASRQAQVESVQQ